MMRGSVLVLNAMLLMACWVPQWALSASSHQHGVARLDVAFDKSLLNIELETPLDVLLGFERAPQTEAERKSVEQMSVKLKASDSLFRIDPSAQCVLASAELNSAVLKLGRVNPSGQAGEGHAELTASFRFDCKGASTTPKAC